LWLVVAAVVWVALMARPEVEEAVLEQVPVVVFRLALRIL
jgi:hypothetical protein